MKKLTQSFTGDTLAIFLDASYLFALYSEIDIHHKRAVAVSQKIESNFYGQPITSADVFDEVLSVALRKFGKEKAQVFGKQILNSVLIIHGNRHVFTAAFKLFNSSKLPFSFTDCTSQAIMHVANVHYIATFDKLFEKLDVKVVC